jgi:hydrogenase maturation factor
MPCRLGLCGPEDKKRKTTIDKYLQSDEKSEKIIGPIIKEFKGAYPYYKLIAGENKIPDPLNTKAVEAYWTGNSLLEKVRVSAYAKMMEKDFLPLGKMSKEKIDKLPKRAIAYHTFHVLFIGSVTGRFQETKKGFDLCRVSWGKVKKVEKNKIVVLRQPLKFGKKIVLEKPKEKKINWNEDILPEVRKGDWVSMHWGTAIEKLDKRKLENIKKYTKHTLDTINGRKK